tara:strand:+ start:204 stop:947 length:744 start_codon:yes stop_codon:yes gene_type:complete
MILSPSWKRADSCFSHKYIPSLKYVVCEDQAESYRKNKLPVLICPNSAQGNVSRVRNWILDNVESKHIVIVDDDLHYIGKWIGNKYVKISSRDIEDFIAYGFEMAEGFGVKYWGINIMSDKGAYREYTPFSLNNVILGPFGGFVDGFEPRYDETLPLKEDYDLSIQALNKYRKILRINFAHYVCKQHTNIGGCASYRTIQREKEQFDKLQKKWGSKIVRRDPGARKNQTKGTTYDINPIIKIPIRGV